MAAGSTSAAAESAPDTGSHPNFTENTSTRSGPRKKFGSEAPTSANPVAAVSSQRPRWRAARAPSGTAIASASPPAAVASRRVAGKQPATRRPTGVPSRSERPRSPRAARIRKSRYCSRSGRSSPSVVRRSARSAVEAVSPSITSTGSPGSRWMKKKTSVATPRTVGSVSRSRRRTAVIALRSRRRRRFGGGLGERASVGEGGEAAVGIGHEAAKPHVSHDDVVGPPERDER